MQGYLHIFRVGTREEAHHRRIAEYQVNYTSGGKTFSRIVDEQGLAELLREQAALDSNALARALEELHRSGNTTVDGVRISENDAAALGMQVSASDY